MGSAYLYELYCHSHSFATHDFLNHCRAAGHTRICVHELWDVLEPEQSGVLYWSHLSAEARLELYSMGAEDEALSCGFGACRQCSCYEVACSLLKHVCSQCRRVDD